MKRLLWLMLLSVGISCSPKPSNDENTLAQISDPEVMKFAVTGKQLYENYCGNCHQNDGKGLGKLIPPLRDADYFKASVHRTVWIMRHGQKDEIVVNGQTYNQAMPGNPQLKPLEIAQIATYLYNIWGMKEGVISSPEVEKYLKEAPEGF
ncbi:MAG: c-type cytochrome [Algoriphagus aquaeductus]|uniref:c-type cytochrome n=1 Tax=Algoriphagus aquaeductus TaxID=475299 RepID=UPI00391CE9ED